jgi:transposase InsO family protein
MKRGGSEQGSVEAEPWDLSLWGCRHEGYDTWVAVGDRATLGSDPSTAAMLYGMAGTDTGASFFDVPIEATTMDRASRMRLRWVQLYEQTQDAGYVCRRCGVSRPTLRKWHRRYTELGIDGLNEVSRRPHASPCSKVTEGIQELILSLRTTRNLGARRIQSELKRLHAITLSLATIHKVLVRKKANPLVTIRSKHPGRSYSRPIPGDRIQMDTKKLGPRRYQYTAVDDCTRYRVLGIYDKRTAANTLTFLDKVIEEFPFPIERIQTDRGREFFSHKVQKKLMECSIKFRPIKPRSPHLNGKVERSQKTDVQEFYSTVDLDDPLLLDKLQEWQHYYNWDRPHGSLNGKTPIEVFFERGDKTPLWDDVEARYDPSKERFQEANYSRDLQIRRLK